MAIQLKTISEVLKFMMVQNKEYLLAQRGKPPVGRCLDCGRDVTAMEIAATCADCGPQPICFECVDAHDHLRIETFLADPRLLPN